MDEIQAEWEGDNEYHKHARLRGEGMRSSQISALVALLMKKGILK